MPRIGRPAPGQMMALWPSIRDQIRVPNPGEVQASSLRRLRLNPAGGVALAGALMCVFLFSVMMYTPASAVGAPVPPVPADIQATPTPFTTSAPGGETATRAVASASLTATLAPSMPVAPAAPEAFVRTLDAPDDASR
jgi:hypothetical protein